MNSEEEAVLLIESYCGLKDGLNYNRMGTLSLKMAIILQKLKYSFSALFQGIFHAQSDLY